MCETAGCVAHIKWTGSIRTSPLQGLHRERSVYKRVGQYSQELGTPTFWSYMYWTRVWNSWLCCTYQVHRVDPQTAPLQGLHREDFHPQHPIKKLGSHGSKFQIFLSGKSVFLNSKFQIQEFHDIEWREEKFLKGTFGHQMEICFWNKLQMTDLLLTHLENYRYMLTRNIKYQIYVLIDFIH